MTPECAHSLSKSRWHCCDRFTWHSCTKISRPSVLQLKSIGGLRSVSKLVQVWYSTSIRCCQYWYIERKSFFACFLMCSKYKSHHIWKPVLACGMCVCVYQIKGLVLSSDACLPNLRKSIPSNFVVIFYITKFQMK